MGQHFGQFAQHSSKLRCGATGIERPGVCGHGLGCFLQGRHPHFLDSLHARAAQHGGERLGNPDGPGLSARRNLRAWHMAVASGEQLLAQAASRLCGPAVRALHGSGHRQFAGCFRVHTHRVELGGSTRYARLCGRHVGNVAEPTPGVQCPRNLPGSADCAECLRRRHPGECPCRSGGRRLAAVGRPHGFAFGGALDGGESRQRRNLVFGDRIR